MNTRKIWKVGRLEETDETLSAVNEIAQQFGLTLPCAKLLFLRGYDSVTKAETFLNNTDLSIYDPFGMKDMDKAARRVCRAIKEGEKVSVMGDYDADGVSATALVYLYLNSKNPDMTPGYYIPDRFAEGYGMSRQAVDILHGQGAKLIITVDTGITAVDEVAYANSLGMDVVVTDHHECREILPDALAVVDSHRPDCGYPFKELAGVGVAFKLITAVEAMLRGETTPSKETVMDIYKRYSDLAMLGTVADVMPVTDENRAIIIRGLEKMRRSPRPGLRALVRRSLSDKKGDTNLTSTSISFGIAPRINAAGRMAHASEALELLLITEADGSCEAVAEKRAVHLCELNTERQQKEADIMKGLEDHVAAQCDLDSDRVLVIADDSWHSGVIGIAASKVCEKYGRPAILVTFSGCTEPAEGEPVVGRGSGRSIEGVNLIEAICACGHHLVKFGGHELAAGLSIRRDRVDAFRTAINAYIKEHETEDMWTCAVKADMELFPEDLSVKFVENVSLLEPFGVANPTPVFFMSDVFVMSARPIGNGSHMKFRLEKEGAIFDAVMFHASNEAYSYSPGEKLDILFHADINEFNGSRKVQLLIRDTRYAEHYMEMLEQEKTRYLRILAGEKIGADEEILPSRDDFAVVYRLLRAHYCESVKELAERRLLELAKADSPHGMNRVKLRVILDVLDEMELCKIEHREGDVIEFHVNLKATRVDLESSPLLLRLRGQCE